MFVEGESILNNQVPFHEQPLIIRRRRLKNKNFSIICQNCIAGFIYHQLGLEFLTPTINLYFFPADFIDLVRNLKFYMNSQLLEDTDANESFPVGILGNKDRYIRIYFNHATKFSDAKIDWERRKKRINYNNLYVIAGDAYGQPYTEQQLQEFNDLPITHKVILTGREFPNIPVAYKINNCCINGHLGQWFNKMGDIRGSRYFEQFDYVDFLNQ